MQNNQGVSIVVVSYKRLPSLKLLLDSIAKQNREFPIELILVNNNPEYNEASYTEKQILNQIAAAHSTQIRFLEAKYNYDVAIRYWVAPFAMYDLVMFLDDDVELLSTEFIRTMRDTFLQNLSETDWLSCWTQKLTASQDYFQTESFTFMNDHGKDLVEVDLVGPGISIFNKKLLHPEVINIPYGYGGIDNVWVPLKASIVLGTKKYFMPSFGMLKFNEYTVEAIYARPDTNEKKSSLTKQLIQDGYTPIINRTS